ncbi:xanthotoxin 5-hydroxylase CYP82C4-like [Nymphaea colorata]|uniref:xanthotoxin 5-hydroxylase CYP82C4-like n=1 Tax=Nymphaea colorata TaxID=210225 RepID=UPI00129D8C6B|nr:xanthotoxin 5-hydroxylase CYP82C4-like [Nymphaea colorata]
MALLPRFPDFPLLSATLFCLLLFFKLLTLFTVKRRRAGSAPDLPTPPGRLPIIGHLHLLFDKSRSLHEIYGELADKYGPAMMLQLGFRRVLVVSSWEMAKECFTTSDLAFSNRPRNSATKHLAYDSTMFGFAPYGDYWRQMRKITTLEMLSNRRIESFKQVRESEIGARVNHIHTLWQNNQQRPVKLEVRKLLSELTFNMVTRTVAGVGYVVGGSEDDSKARETAHCTREMLDLLAAFVVSDFLPFLEFLDINGCIAAMKRVAGNLDVLIGRCVAEHRRQNLSGFREGDHDFIDVLLSLVGDDTDADMVVKTTALAMIIGGNDTTSATLIQTLHLLLLNPQALKKAQDELDKAVGKGRIVDESDISKLVYLQAVVKESFRLRPPTPLLPPREAREDCQIGGFGVPAGTMLVVNAWKIQRDPRVWPDHAEFQPERFLESDVDVGGQHFQLIPFGSGRRVCPGISFSLRSVYIVLARLLHSFDMELHPETVFEESKAFGRTTMLHVLLSPRLPDSLYS